MAGWSPANLAMLLSVVLSATGIGPFAHRAAEHLHHHDQHCHACEHGEPHFHADPGDPDHEHGLFSDCDLCQSLSAERSITPPASAIHAEPLRLAAIEPFRLDLRPATTTRDHRARAPPAA